MPGYVITENMEVKEGVEVMECVKVTEGMES